MFRINNEDIDENKKINLTKNLTLTYNPSKTSMIIFDNSEEEEIVLNGCEDNVLFATKLNDKSFVSVSKDNSIKIWTVQGKLVSSIEKHEQNILGLYIVKNGIYSISKNKGVLEISCQFDKILLRTDNERRSRF